MTRVCWLVRDAALSLTCYSVERYWWYRVWEWIRIRRIWIKPKINETINFRSMKASGPVHIGLEVSRISTLELQTFPSTEPWSWCFFSRHFEGLTEYCNALVLSIRWLERFAPLALYFCLQLDHLSILSQLWPLLRCITFPISQSNIAKNRPIQKWKKKHSPWCQSSRWLFTFYLVRSIINFHSRC